MTGMFGRGDISCLHRIHRVLFTAFLIKQGNKESGKSVIEVMIEWRFPSIFYQNNFFFCTLILNLLTASLLPGMTKFVFSVWQQVCCQMYSPWKSFPANFVLVYLYRGWILWRPGILLFQEKESCTEHWRCSRWTGIQVLLPSWWVINYTSKCCTAIQRGWGFSFQVLRIQDMASLYWNIRPASKQKVLVVHYWLIESKLPNFLKACCVDNMLLL